MTIYDPDADDLELWITGYLRGWLTGQGQTAYVSNTDPPSPEPFEVRARFDGGYPLSMVTESSTFGITVTGPDTDTTGQQTADLARLVRRALVGIPLTDRSNPVVLVDSVPRFARIIDQDSSRPSRYAHVTLVTVAEQPI